MYQFYYKKIALILFYFIIAQSNHPYPPLSLVTIPTSGTLPAGNYSLEALLINDGGIIPRLSIGITDDLTLGVSWGVQNLIGDIRPTFNKEYPDYHFKYRLWGEDLTKPGVVLGFDSQGRGKFRYIDDSIIGDYSFGRYDQKSFGYYLIMSKNYNFMGNFGFHLGINKTLENEDGDDDLNILFGIDKELNRDFVLMFEYDAMLNDNKNQYDYEDLSFGKGIGYLNIGLRWSISDNLLLELNFNDISRNQNISETAHREFKILYSKKF